MTQAILRLPAVKQRTGLSFNHLYTCSGREIPSASLTRGRAIGWVESEIDEWIEQQITASRKQPVASSGSPQIQCAASCSGSAAGSPSLRPGKPPANGADCAIQSGPDRLWEFHPP